MEGELKRILQDEAERRQRFTGHLLDLVTRWKRRSSQGEASVEQLVRDLQAADDIVSPLLRQCRDLCLEDVQSRKEKSEHRDSGLPPSSDLQAVKRRGVFVSPSERLSAEGCSPEVQRPATPPLATQNTDESSDADSASS